MKFLFAEPSNDASNRYPENTFEQTSNERDNSDMVEARSVRSSVVHNLAQCPILVAHVNGAQNSPMTTRNEPPPLDSLPTERMSTASNSPTEQWPTTEALKQTLEEELCSSTQKMMIKLRLPGLPTPVMFHIDQFRRIKELRRVLRELCPELANNRFRFVIHGIGSITVDQESSTIINSDLRDSTAQVVLDD